MGVNNLERGISSESWYLEDKWRQYVLTKMFFLLMSSGDERNILKVFVAGREIDLAPPVHPPSPGALECHLVV